MSTSFLRAYSSLAQAVAVLHALGYRTLPKPEHVPRVYWDCGRTGDDHFVHSREFGTLPRIVYGEVAPNYPYRTVIRAAVPA